jgi:hypothetical protein
MLALVMAKPFLHCHHRFKNGKDHCYWSIAEKVRTARGWVQRHILYLGEIKSCGISCIWRSFGASGWLTRGRALAGVMCSKR